MKSLNFARKIIAINKGMRGENMVQKGNFKDVLVMKGMGAVKKQSKNSEVHC